jgi:hypothetical protein
MVEDSNLGAYRDSVWIVTGYRGLGPMFKKWKFDFVIDARNTLVSNASAKLLGLRLGMEYRRVHRFGVGFYNLAQDVHLNSLREVNADIAEANLALGYASLFYERVLYFQKKWEWSATLHQGIGHISGDYRLAGDTVWQKFDERVVRPFEVSTTGYYNLTWWCSIGAGVGYRLMRSTPAEVRPVYNAPVVIARVRIKLGKLTKSIWDKNIKYEY